MVRKVFLVACLAAGFGVIATLSILTQAGTDEPLAAQPINQVDVNGLTLNAPDLPIELIRDPI